MKPRTPLERADALRALVGDGTVRCGGGVCEPRRLDGFWQVDSGRSSRFVCPGCGRHVFVLDRVRAAMTPPRSFGVSLAAVARRLPGPYDPDLPADAPALAVRLKRTGTEVTITEAAALQAGLRVARSPVRLRTASPGPQITVMLWSAAYPEAHELSDAIATLADRVRERLPAETYEQAHLALLTGRPGEAVGWLRDAIPRTDSTLDEYIHLSTVVHLVQEVSV